MFRYRSQYQIKPNRFRQKEKYEQIWNLFKEIWKMVGVFFDVLVSLPISILDKFGIQLIPNLFLANLPLCSICICGAFLGMTSAVGIGLGVGLGVGLNCKETQYINRTYNITNVTNSNITTIMVVSYDTTSIVNGTNTTVG